MTNTDKTRQKLVNSMRKSKEVARKQPVAETATTKTSSPGKKRSKKKKTTTAMAGTQSARDSSEIAKNVAAKSGSARVASDPYQNGRRVWPD